MTSQKRKASEDWVDSRLVDSEGRRGVYLATFSGIVPPEKTTFREYKRQRTGGQTKVDVILQGETERIEFEGRARVKGNVESSQYAIGILNRDRGTVKLVPAPMLEMERSIKALKAKAGRSAPETPSKIREQRIALGQAFGSKRSKKAIQSQLSGQVDTNALENIAGQIFENVKTATENLPSQDILLDELNADRPIPAIDLSAATLSGLYSLDAIVSASELAMIDADAIYALPDEESRLAAIPNSQFINDQLKAVFRQKEKDIERLRMLFYAALLISFFKNHRLASKRLALRAALGSIPNVLLDGLLSRFTEEQRTSTKTDAKKQSVCTPKCQDKVVCYLFVLCLMLDDFSVDISQMAHDLQMAPKKAHELFRTVGCKIVAISDTERQKRGLTKSEAKTHKLARLQCPPEFPRVRRPAGGSRRR